MPNVLLAGLLALSLASFSSGAAEADEAAAPAPKLLLSAKLLRRLKRDRDRQTPRWLAFEKRVKGVPDSPERGFELALYYAITGEGSYAKQAAAWATAHPCERRQRALISDWTGESLTGSCPGSAAPRDEAFEQILKGGDTGPLAEKVRSEFIPNLAKNGVPSAADLYATVELLSALRANGGSDVRSAAPGFFRNLPVEFLLSLPPKEVEKPDWMAHIAALALITLDPNLEASQFLQGWAIEDHQTLQEGPGVAYEFLWADPYLPGIAYQNLDPWLYDPDGKRLFARSDWSVNACWIGISGSGVKELNCPAGWRDQPIQFGTMTLTPMTAKCLTVEHQDKRKSLVVWKLAPDEVISYRYKKEQTTQADSSGLWRPGENVEGKVCRR